MAVQEHAASAGLDNGQESAAVQACEAGLDDGVAVVVVVVGRSSQDSTACSTVRSWYSSAVAIAGSRLDTGRIGRSSCPVVRRTSELVVLVFDLIYCGRKKQRKK